MLLSINYKNKLSATQNTDLLNYAVTHSVLMLHVEHARSFNLTLPACFFLSDVRRIKKLFRCGIFRKKISVFLPPLMVNGDVPATVHTFFYFKGYYTQIHTNTKSNSIIIN